jgi:hypothetical protein
MPCCITQRICSLCGSRSLRQILCTALADQCWWIVEILMTNHGCCYFEILHCVFKLFFANIFASLSFIRSFYFFTINYLLSVIYLNFTLNFVHSFSIYIKKAINFIFSINKDFQMLRILFGLIIAFAYLISISVSTFPLDIPRKLWVFWDS